MGCQNVFSVDFVLQNDYEEVNLVSKSKGLHCTDRAPKWSLLKAYESFNLLRPLRESFGEAFKWARSLARRTEPGILFPALYILESQAFLVFVLVISVRIITIHLIYTKYLVYKYQEGPPTIMRTTNQSVKPPSFLQTRKVSSNHILGALVEEQLLVLLETEATKVVQEVERQSGKIGVAVAVDVDTVVVEALDTAAVDIA